MPDYKDFIEADQFNNLHQIFRQRLELSPNKTAYSYFDLDEQKWAKKSWSDIADEIAVWQAALLEENLGPGDSVAIMLRNSCEWVIFDQAALSLGLVVVPLYTEDRSENISYILNDSNVQLLLLENADQWDRLHEGLKKVSGLKRILSMESLTGTPHDPRLRWIKDWLPAGKKKLVQADVKSDALATIVYTSGTTGRPKGVMLSHQNLLWNVQASLVAVDVYSFDVFLSFLPLSHTLERTIGYYFTICTGSQVAFARSVADLAEDMLAVRPTVLITVPRIFERVQNKINEQLMTKSSIAVNLFRDAVEVGYQKFLYDQGKQSWRTSFLFLPLLRLLVSRKILAKFGGRLRICISGGAALSKSVSRTFIGLGLNILQGYGLTEHSPVISVNRMNDNDPASVGPALPGVETKLADDGELLVRSPSVMQGYLNNIDATEDVIDEEGWLHTGDKAEIHDKKIYITGRSKEIIVMSNGEKVPPVDMEMAILEDPLFEQAMIVGESRAFLSALLVLNPEAWANYASANQLDPLSVPREQQIEMIKTRIEDQLREFPGYAQVHQITVCNDPWTIDNAMLTPTLKLRRKHISAKYHDEIEKMYDGH